MMWEVPPDSSLDQNFLTDKRIAKKMASYINGPVVLEIGPGLGIITEYLITRAKKVIAYEKDIRLVGFLQEKFKKDTCVEIIHGDFLKAGNLEFDEVISNLPFSVSTKILFKLLDYDFNKAVLGFQKEVAEKIVSKEGKEYGRLSVVTQHYFDVKYLFTIPSYKFHPRPKVNCGVVELSRKDIMREKEFEEFIRELFKYPNKNLNKVLKMTYGIEWKDTRKLRQITPEEYYNLYLELKEKLF